MLTADSTSIDDSLEHLLGERAGGPDEGSLGSTIEAVELLDLLDLVREDARLGSAMLGREMRRLVGEAAAMDRSVADLEEAGHVLAMRAAAQAAALPRLGMMRRLLDQHMSALAATLESAAGSDESREAETIRDSLAEGLRELEAVIAPIGPYADALAKVIGTSLGRSGAENDIAAGIEACCRRLERFEARLLLTLRPSSVQERRRAPRLPVRIRAALQCGDRRWRGETVDLAKGGVLVAVDTPFDRPPVGGSARLELADLDTFPARIVGLSAKGVHLAFDNLTPIQRRMLDGRLAALAALDSPFVNLARWAAREVEAGFARGVAEGEISETALFASPAGLLATPGAVGAPDQPAERSLAAAARDFLGKRLTPLQTQIAASRCEVVYATCSDRHGYLAVVTAGPAAAAMSDGIDGAPAILGLSGALDESESGIVAARNRRTQLVASPIPGVREVAVPITVEGRHWGAFRLGFSPEKTSPMGGVN